MMKKNWKVVASILIFCIALAGCGTSSDSSAETTAPASVAAPATDSSTVDDFYEEQLENQDEEVETWAKAPDDMDVMETPVIESTLDEVIEEVFSYVESNGMVVRDEDIYDKIRILYIAEEYDAFDIFSFLCDEGLILYSIQFNGNEGPIIVAPLSA